MNVKTGTCIEHTVEDKPQRQKRKKHHALYNIFYQYVNWSDSFSEYLYLEMTFDWVSHVGDRNTKKRFTIPSIMTSIYRRNVNFVKISKEQVIF